jgi:hypothetical protein
MFDTFKQSWGSMKESTMEQKKQEVFSAQVLYFGLCPHINDGARERLIQAGHWFGATLMDYIAAFILLKVDVCQSLHAHALLLYSFSYNTGEFSSSER